jgi:long-subunit acyl-CoA synthetase (AMP-forming)
MWNFISVGGIEYLLCEYALLKLGNVIRFPISARNSPSAIEHLLGETKTNLLITKNQYLPMLETLEGQEEFQSLKILNLDTNQLNIEEFLKRKDLPCSSQRPRIKKE